MISLKVNLISKVRANLVVVLETGERAMWYNHSPSACYQMADMIRSPQCYVNEDFIMDQASMPAGGQWELIPAKVEPLKKAPLVELRRIQCRG